LYYEVQKNNRRRGQMKDFLGTAQRIKQFEGKKGAAVKNQFLIYTDKGIVFQSYNSVVAAKVGDKVYLDKNDWDYSVTTGKYRNQFLGETRTETEQKIKSGQYILTNLNT